MKKSFHALTIIILAASAVLSAQQQTSKKNAADSTPLDASKYITIDEVKPGMEAYCLTIFEGTKIEKFDLEVLSVVRNFRPGMDAILVKGLDERFIHTGPVGGCSGSPVYIEGRMAGALAFGWTFSKDPLYGVTPIKDMLRVGQIDNKKRNLSNNDEPGLVFDYSTPISFKDIHQMLSEPFLERKSHYGSMQPLPCPLVITGTSAQAYEIICPELENLGLMAVAGIGAGIGSNEAPSQESIQLVPGACLAVPLVSGDISIKIVGTVTEVQDKKVYGFGHSYLGYGPVNLPMATGKVHTVVSSISRSFKLASAEEIVGTLRMDEATGIVGSIGEEPKMIPLKMTVERYNDAVKREYDCRIVDNRLLTPNMLRISLNAAAMMLGPMPPYNTLEYDAKIGLKQTEEINFKNISANIGPTELVSESVGALALLMNNPYQDISIESLEFDVRITNKNIISHIWSVNVSDSTVKAGEKIDVSVVIESFLEGKKVYDFSFEMPENAEPGKYQLLVAGAKDYEAFLRQYSSHKFLAENFESLTKALNNLLGIDRDRLYCMLLLRPDGVTMQKAELPDLPDTKVLILQSPKRTLKAQPYMHWLEKSFNTQTIVIDKQTMNITVHE
ncbi:MAG: SpoIVB peptidase S55 domain-containing protein [Planctomycetota bacterium]|jgi:hypothetical protein